MKKPWQIAEKKVAKIMGFKVQPRSGGISGYKSDIKGGKIQAEHKYTEKDYFRLELKMLKKIDKEALQAGREPALIFTFKKNLKPNLPKSYILSPHKGETIDIRYSTRHKSFLIFDLLLIQCLDSIVSINFDNREKGYPKNWILRLLEGEGR